MQQKADTAAGATGALSGVSLWMSQANQWVAEYMPLISAVGILGGLLVTAWYYWACHRQRKREEALRWRELEDHHRQREHELMKHQEGE